MFNHYQRAKSLLSQRLNVLAGVLISKIRVKHTFQILNAAEKLDVLQTCKVFSLPPDSWSEDVNASSASSDLIPICFTSTFEGNAGYIQVGFTINYHSQFPLSCTLHCSNCVLYLHLWDNTTTLL